MAGSPQTFAEITTLVLQTLQDTGASTYDATETGFAIENGLREFSKREPHFVEIRFQIESRTGTDTAGTASSLTDATRSQFVSGDVGKRVRNTTEKTWAVIETFSSTSVVTLNADIMNNGDQYEIYNKNCNNNKQIFIGDIKDYLGIEVVEYPIGSPRNWEVNYDVLEIFKDTVEDSDPTRDPPNDIEVLVRFAKPHRLLQLTDEAGELTANGTKGDKSIGIDGMGDTEIIERGDEFRIEHHSAIYTITADVTTSANAATINFIPGLEAASTDNDDITFFISTLLPDQEILLTDLVVAMVIKSDLLNFINKTNALAYRDFLLVANDRLVDVQNAIGQTKRRTKRMYPRT